MYFTALATDYDGTLAQDGAVPEKAIDRLKKLKGSGRRLILVTGRILPDLKQVFPQYGLFDSIVAENGGLFYTPATEEEKVLATEPPAAFVERLRQMKIEPLSVGRTIVATWEPNEIVALELIRELGLEHHIVFNKGAVMMLPAGVSKASGLAAALREMGISPFNTIAIGDAENDHAFLQFSGCAVAVANALDSVKAEADIVTKGARFEGVCEVIDTLLDGRESDLIKAVQRHGTVFATDASGEKVAIFPTRGSMLISGQSGAGKSTLSTVLLERLIERGFQVCIFDPEGDYTELEGAIIVGDPKTPPMPEAIFDLLQYPEISVVVNMLAIDIDDRPVLFSNLLSRLAAMRAAAGRPHWILIDEAHHMLPAARDNVRLTMPTELPSAVLVTVHPSSVAPAALELIDLVIGIGGTAQEAIGDCCATVGDPPPDLPGDRVGGRQALLWSRRTKTGKLITVKESKQTHKRHTRKYAQGDLGEDKSFYFRGPDNALNLRAQNLMLFVQIGNGVDDATWLHHLKRGDYSEWFRTAIKDHALADDASAVEKDTQLSAQESRERIMDAVNKRYTAPASVNDNT